MFTANVQNAINEQINQELYSAYVYLSMVGYFESSSLPGFAHWMRMQSREEVGHAMRLFDYLLDRGGRAALQAIDKPPADFSSPLEAIQQTLEHEQRVTSLIEGLYEVALKENDYATQAQLQWFVTEQVEEEKNAGMILDQLKMVGENRTAMLMLDMELAKRQPEAE